MSFLKKHFLNVFFLVVFSSGFLLSQQVFEVNLNDRADDKFHVTLYPEKLSKDNDIFYFAASAPGTYQTMDIGRFVSDFKVFDSNGNEISTVNNATNQWTISDPSAVKKITYKVADIWDTPITENVAYAMCTSTISDDFVLINGQAVFGYFKGMQSEPLKIKIDYPSYWSLGTPLKIDKEGYYFADTYDKIVDSPFYLGNLTKATTEVGGTNIDVYTYSKSGLITSKDILDLLKDILNAEAKFTKGLPVDNYTFLFHFGDVGAGAWEHSYSSGYVLNIDSLNESSSEQIKSFVAHEFFHVTIPLNVHSELVEKFNFVTPIMSQHLWFYEGVTEWAAHILQLRDKLTTLEEYLATTQGKIRINDFYDKNLSLTELGIRSTELPQQYYNIYQKGAVVAGLLDLRLLELSGGKKGLRELIIELMKIYGPKHSFSEKDFFNELVKMTYPEINDFINKYIKGTEELPLSEYYNYIGIDYNENAGVDSSRSSLGITITTFHGGTLGISSSHFQDSGLKTGDIIEKVDGVPLTTENVQQIFGDILRKKVGEQVNFTIKREDKKIELTETFRPRKIKHLLTVAPNPTPEQLKLREAWLKNL